MAKILTTKALAAALETIIRKADNELFLISYSFKIEGSYIRHIGHAADRGVKIKIIYGESLKSETEKALADIQNIEILQYPGLHAKIYSNNTECIIGSMNFYDYSEHHNTELGCLITNTDDKEAFEDAIRHCREIYKEALLMQLKVNNSSDIKKGKKELIYEQAGYCIRTGTKIPFSLEKPLSSDAYKSWSKYEDKDYPEKYCHFSGEPSHGETSYSKPILKKNWKQAQKIHNLKTT